MGLGRSFGLLDCLTNLGLGRFVAKAWVRVGCGELLEKLGIRWVVGKAWDRVCCKSLGSDGLLEKLRIRLIDGKSLFGG
jgi:hypothetical protein